MVEPCGASRAMSRRWSGALVLAVASALRPVPFEPRAPPRLPRPFFNGWCLRAMDAASGCSATAIVGCFSRGRRRYAEHLVAVAARVPSPSGGREVLAAQRVYGGDECAVTSFAEGEGPRFSFEAPCGSLDVRGGHARAAFTVADVAGRPVTVALETASASPWASGGGAEGWLGSPLASWALPCRYHVRCVDSVARASASGGDGAGAWASDGALLHAESNFGRAFPKKWAWCQAAQAGKSVLAVGGTFKVGPVPLRRTWLVRYASEAVDWDFRTTDLRTRAAARDLRPPLAEGGGDAVLDLALERRTRGEVRVLEVRATASRDAFLDEALYVPTPRGFSKAPGTREAFAATVAVRASLREGGETRVVETATFDGACLEFGGDYLLL